MLKQTSRPGTEPRPGDELPAHSPAPHSRNQLFRQVLTVRATPERIEANLTRMVADWQRQHRARYLNIPGLQREFDIGEQTARCLAFAIMECGR